MMILTGDRKSIGSSYSVADYSVFEKNRDHNLFEEIIDMMVASDVPGMNDEVKETIKNLPRKSKRMVILGLIDKNYGLFKKIKALTNKDLNRLEHIKDVLQMLRDYVKVGEVEKKKFGEVMTPIELVKEMLDTLPKEVWSNPNLKWLDPANGTGPFPCMVILGLMKGLKEWEPDDEKRYRHIVENMIYVCEIQPKNMFLYLCAVDPFDTYKLNVYTGSFLEDGFDYHMKEVWGVDKFDIVIGNPPYQRSDGGGTGDSATPIYNLFIEKSIGLNPFYITMVVPSKWMIGGKGLDKFRQMMIDDKRLSLIFDYKNSDTIFKNVYIDGGIMYFLWDSNHNDKLRYSFKDLNGGINTSVRYLRNEISDVVIRDYTQISIVEKCKTVFKFSDIVSARKPYGFRADIFNNPEKYNRIRFSDTEIDGYSKIYGVSGIKGGCKRVFKFVHNEDILNGRESIYKYKLFFSKAFNIKSTVPPEIIIGLPNTICSETFIEIGPFETLEEAENCLSYIKTKFFRALLFYRRHSLNISKKVFEFIPLLDFKKSYTDGELYKMFNLTDDEISYIETNIKPMN